MELRNSIYRIRSLAGRCDYCPAARATHRVTLPLQRHLDLTRAELTWLYKKAFGHDPNGVDDANICVSIQMMKGFAWAVQEIEERRNQVNVNNPTVGGNIQ